MNYLFHFLLVVCLYSMTLFKPGFAEAETKPNVLVLIGDDHASYVYGAYGNPKARTPNLDRLARSGVRFTNAFANCPMCTASRQSLLTGRLPHSIGVTQLQTALSDEPLTLAELLKEYGYDAACIGKMHFNNQLNDPPLNHGFDTMIDIPDHNRYLKEHPAHPILKEFAVLPPWRPFQEPARIWLNGSYLPFGAYDEDMSGTWFARQAQDYLRSRKGKPFLLFASFYEPHSPYRFPIEYRNMFDPKTFEVPQPGPDDDWQIPEIFRDLTDSEKQRITASYYTSTAFLDKNIGLVLDALDESGLSDNTIVVYFGDHGYHLGHHGRFEKHSFYERAPKAPLVFRIPGITPQGEANDALVEFIDIFPTIAAACGAAPPKEVEGENLIPIMKGEKKELRWAVFSEYTENEEAMIRTHRYKLIYSSGKRERQDGYQTGRPAPQPMRLLFDLEKDPEEMTNLAAKEEYEPEVVKLEREMLRRLKETYPQQFKVPAGLGLEEALDWYLQPRDAVMRVGAEKKGK
ncbi:MAG: sulfatase-like hydrolase/transferase [Candidatus Omnitrophota bacterium]